MDITNNTTIYETRVLTDVSWNYSIIGNLLDFVIFILFCVASEIIISCQFSENISKNTQRVTRSAAAAAAPIKLTAAPIKSAAAAPTKSAITITPIVVASKSAHIVPTINTTATAPIPYKKNKAHLKLTSKNNKKVSFTIPECDQSSQPGTSATLNRTSPKAKSSPKSSKIKKQPIKKTPAGTTAVLKLIEKLEDNMNYKLFYDNWFSSPSITIELMKRGFHTVSTVQINRVKGINFPLSAKEFSKTPRGSVDSMVNDEEGIVVVRWNDNKPVHLISSYVGHLPVQPIYRWSKASKKKIIIDCPKIVSEYNRHMGGVDLTNMLAALYRINRKSKKYYTR